MALPSAGCDNRQPAAGQPAAPRAPEGVAGKDQGSAAKPRDPAIENKKTASPAGPFRFTDIRPGSGVDFVHVSGMTEAKQFPTANGSGVAIFDFDNDGKMDLCFATGNLLPIDPARAGANRLYRNTGGGRFEDVTERSGLGFRGYCHGVITGDVDNDGDQDVFLCNFGGDALFLNNGNGTFSDISGQAGVRAPDSWSSSAAFLDFDNDGDLDLYVTRYGDWQWPRDDRFCGDSKRKIRRYCSPKELRPVRHVLFRNNGDHTFSDCTRLAGIDRADGHGFGAVAADLDGDNHVDLYVANDQDPNFLFLNRGNGTFRDATDESGAGLNIEGRTSAGMGVDAEDLDGDGTPELFVTNFQEEYNTLFKNLRPGIFLDVTAVFGLAVDSLPWIGWGCALADFDGDGWPDIVVANGHIDDNARFSVNRRVMPSLPCCIGTWVESGSSSPRPGRGPTSRPATLPMAWPAATWTTTATWTLSSATRTAHPRYFATTRRSKDAGFDSSWSARARIATRSARRFSSKPVAASSTACGKVAAA